MAFLVINLPGDIMPLERRARFENPVVNALAAEEINGRCVGGGSFLFESDGRRFVGSCDIELELKDEDLERAIPVIRRALIEAGAPVGTTIHQDKPEEKISQLYDEV